MQTRFRRLLACLVGSFLLAEMALAQEVEVRVGENVLVGKEAEGKVLIEPHVAAHPTDSQHLLAVGWVELTTAGRSAVAGSHCAAFLSKDGGSSWARRDLPGESCADPWVTLTSRGAVLTAIGRHPSLADSTIQLLTYFSFDGGESWHGVPQSLGRNHDGPRSVADADGRTYVLSAQALSDRAGRRRFSVFLGRRQPSTPHIETMQRIVPSNLNLNTDDLVVLADGRLVVTYHDFGRSVGGRMTRAGALKTRRIWAMVSSDGGHTFSVPLLATESCYARPSDMAADTSAGPYRDRLYLVCMGDHLQSILLTHSADGAEEWSTATPIEPSTSQPRARQLPQVAVNASGVVAVAWMDRRDDPAGRCYAPYVAASADGGKTFSPAVRVASQLSCPDTARVGSFVAGRWAMGGDYFGLTAGADGRFHVVWPDARDGSFQIWTAPLTVIARGAGAAPRDD